MMKRTLTAACALVLTVMQFGYAQASLGLQVKDERGFTNTFANPSPDARPHVYWYWMGGNISRVGITADLEAMARVGIGGAAIFNIGGHGAQGKVVPLTPEWRELMSHALREAKRLGIEINLNNSMVGWSSSGGPWITPELAMQCLTWSETAVSGQQSATGKVLVLPQPPGHLGFYRDVAVLAFPTPEADFGTNACELTSNMERFERKLVERFSDVPMGRSWDKNDAAPAVAVQMKVPDKSVPFIQWTYTEAVVQRSMQITSRSGVLSGTLKASDDGAVWREVQVFASRNHAPVTCAFEAAPARFWRVEFKPNEGMWLTGVRLWSGYRLANYTGKAMFDPYGLDCPKFSNDGKGETGNVKRGACFVQPDKMVDLTDKMKADGTLDWKVPEGRWTILRFGYAPTGSESEPGVPGVRSLECDKFNPKALEVHFAKSLQPWFDDPELNAAVQYVHVDSYERGAQNWTEALPALFWQRKGYDLRTWLPALTGRVVGSVRESEQFLWDFRNVTCGLMHENYFGRMAELCEKAGKRFTCEPYHQTQFNNVTAGGYAHIPMCEAWMGDSIPGPYWMKLGASPGHLYGRRIVAAEAFTAPAKSGGNWSIDFFDMKELGDAMFCGGVNRFMYHVYVQQPWTNVAPGQTLAIYGTHFERTNTWFEKMKAFNAYVTRCQALLQQGLFVGDVLYSCGENNPSENVHPGGALAMPNGYDYDVCDPRAIRERITVKDGQLVLPDGVSYRLLVLPDDASMTLTMLRCVEALVKDGATIVGRTKPMFSPTLSDMPEQMGSFLRLADTLWDSGKVISDKTVAEVLKLKGIPPDFEARGAKAQIRYIHRREGGTDSYFVASSGKEAQKVEAVFRATGQPVLLDAVTGESRVLPEYRVEDGRTVVPMNFEAKQSFFVVFKTGNSKLETGNLGKMNFPEMKPIQALTGSWSVQFDPKWGGPSFAEATAGKPAQPVVFHDLSDWTAQSDSGIKYYSGTAVYRKLFDCRLPAADCPLYLSLGAVKNMADVTINGRKLGTVWCAPWRVAIPAGVLKEKGNELEIEVVNLWPNRMIGDEQLPEDCDWGGGVWNLLKSYPEWFVNKIPRTSGRKTFSTVKQWYKEDPLLPSGLLGPVTVQAEYGIALMAIQSGYAQVTLGLQVKDGRFYKDGHVYRGVGANYFDLFRRVMREPTNTTSLIGLERLSKAGIPFVRFAGPFSAEEWKLYVENKEEYFKRMDLVFRKAEEVKMGLIPSFFWTLTLCETVNEPCDQWGNPDSKTAALMREYVKDICTRYGKSQALWAYEFGNEMNLSADLPNAAQFRPKNGSEKDDVTSKILVTMLSDFAKEVRKYDPTRAIISGNSHSRASAWNNTASKSWKADTQEQAKEVLLRDNPAPLDTVGIHIYGDHKPEKEIGNWVQSRLAYFKWLRGLADDVKRPIFIGEYGCAIQESPEKNRETYEALLKEMTEANIDMAAFWVYDLPSQNKDWNVTFENSRAYMIPLAAEANRTWHKQ